TKGQLAHLCEPLDAKTVDARSRAEVSRKTTRGLLLPEVGERNTSLFDYARSVAQSDLLDEEVAAKVSEENSRMQEPLGDREVGKLVDSALRYRREGRLFRKGSQNIITPEDALIDLTAYPNAFVLLLRLKRALGGLPQFAVPQKWWAKELGW